MRYRYEYKTESLVTLTGPEALVAFCNGQGAEGWELVQVILSQASVPLSGIFKRRAMSKSSIPDQEDAYP